MHCTAFLAVATAVLSTTVAGAAVAAPCAAVWQVSALAVGTCRQQANINNFDLKVTSQEHANAILAGQGECYCNALTPAVLHADGACGAKYVHPRTNFVDRRMILCDAKNYGGVAQDLGLSQASASTDKPWTFSPVVTRHSVLMTVPAISDQVASADAVTPCAAVWKASALADGTCRQQADINNFGLKVTSQEHANAILAGQGECYCNALAAAVLHADGACGAKYVHPRTNFVDRRMILCDAKNYGGVAQDLGLTQGAPSTVNLWTFSTKSAIAVSPKVGETSSVEATSTATTSASASVATSTSSAATSTSAATTSTAETVTANSSAATTTAKTNLTIASPAAPAATSPPAPVPQPRCHPRDKPAY
ncbi:hypothetical protein HKX48_004394 [Thoreauomyces humboldtii]|nr:hypothetical protein HKX48_004394 [Thoreauomyces humboldtii]